MIYAASAINKITDVSVDNVRPSNDFATLNDASRGGGYAELTGAYTGQDDLDVTVEIVDDASTLRPISQPTFTGYGNGNIENLSAANTVPTGLITVALKSVGSVDQYASVPFAGVILKAKSPGPGGNGIKLELDYSGLTFTRLDVSIPEVAQSGAQTFVGPLWNFGGVDLENALVPSNPPLVPTNAPFILIAGATHIYRQYRTFVEGQYNYSFAPKLRAEYAKNSNVFSVTGGVSATVTQGATVETYTNIRTLYDLLSKLRLQSALIDVDGVVVDDRSIFGMATEPMSIRTKSGLVSVTATGAASPSAITYVPESTAPGETVLFTCVDNSTAGAEIWNVSGSVSGNLPQLTTAVEYVNPAISRAVVAALNNTVTGRGSITHNYVPITPPGVSCLNLYKPVLGRNASSKTLTFRYEERGSDDCDCDTVPVDGRPDPDFLGVDTEGGSMDRIGSLTEKFRREIAEYFSGLYGSGVAAIEASDVPAPYFEYERPLVAPATFADIYRYSGTQAVGGGNIARANTFLAAVLNSAQSDVESALVTSLTEDAFPPAWKPEEEYFESQYIRIEKGTFAMSYFYECTTEGVSDLTEPTWASTGTITDGTAVWTPVDSAFTIWKAKWSAFKSAFTSAISGGSIWYDVDWTSGTNADIFARRYTAIFGAAELGKFDASGGVSGWRDTGAPFWWRCTNGPYMPVFTNVYYTSVVSETGLNGKPLLVNTKEFGFAFQTCPDKLTPGDTITVVVDANGSGQRYGIGDTFEVKLSKGENVVTSNGADAVTENVWSVTGRPDYVIPDPTAPPTYNESGLAFVISYGDRAFRLGDEFSFSVEGARFRYRIGAGSWVGPSDLQTTSLGDGVDLVFRAGKSPSFVTGDSWVLRAVAQYGANALLNQGDGRFAQWTAPGHLTFKVTEPLNDFFMFTDATLSQGIMGVLEGSDDSFTTIKHTANVVKGRFVSSEPLEAVDWRVSLTSAGTAGFIFAGNAFRFVRPATSRITDGRVSSLEFLQSARGDVTHENVSRASYDSFIELAKHCKKYAQGVVCAVEPLNDAGYRFVIESITGSEYFGQSADSENQRFRVELQLGEYL